MLIKRTPKDIPIPDIPDISPNTKTPKKDRGKHFFAALKWSLLGCFVAITLLNTVFFLQEDEYGVIRTLGSTSIVETPGMKFKIPYLQHVTKVSKAAKQFSVGYSLETDESIYNESFMITSDYNFVNVDFYFEYQITDPIKYLYAAEAPETVVKNLAQSYIRDTVGSCKVDDVLTTGKYAIQTTVKTKLQERLAAEDIGIQVTNAVIQDAEVPTEKVKQAFKNVEDAKQGMDTAINNANADANTRIPKAEADADKIIKDAQAKKESLIAEAEGQTARFNSLYAEYAKFPLITKQRMFYETMEDILPGMKVYISDGSTQTLLPLEPFSSMDVTGSSNATDNSTSLNNPAPAGNSAAANSSNSANSPDNDSSEDEAEDYDEEDDYDGEEDYDEDSER